MLDPTLISDIYFGTDGPQKVWIIDAKYNDRPMTIPELWAVQEIAFELFYNLPIES